MDASLRYFSSYIPGGVGTMIALTRLSADERVRQVAFDHKSGPAHRLTENAFNSRVACDSPSAFGLGWRQWSDRKAGTT
jgi:hypothetical protein